MNRRSFFAFLPLAPFVAAGSVEAQAKPDISAGAPRDNEMKITIQGSTDRPIGNKYIGNFTMSEPDPSRNVAMSVGEDGNLWLKSQKGQWKRVVTE